MQALLSKQTSSRNRLSKILKINGLFAFLCAIDLLLFSDWLAQVIGFAVPLYLQVLAVVLFGFSGLVFWISNHVEKHNWVSSIIQLDRSWVLGSGILVLFYSDLFSTLGLVLIAIVAIVVAIFAMLQNHYLKQLTV